MVQHKDGRIRRVRTKSTCPAHMLSTDSRRRSKFTGEGCPLRHSAATAWLAGGWTWASGPTDTFTNITLKWITDPNVRTKHKAAGREHRCLIELGPGKDFSKRIKNITTQKGKSDFINLEQLCLWKANDRRWRGKPQTGKRHKMYQYPCTHATYTHTAQNKEKRIWTPLPPQWRNCQKH